MIEKPFYHRNRTVLRELTLLELGSMVNLKDFRTIKVPESSFSELLMLNGDLERIARRGLKGILACASPPIRFVHTQEFVTFEDREELVDLSSRNDGLRKMCVEIVERTRELASELGNSQVIIHPGGIRESVADRGGLLNNLQKSLEEIGPDKLLLENMPWYYWLGKSGRMIANLCVSAEDMERFSDFVEGLTLDTCHGYLSRPKGVQTYCSRFMSRLGHLTAHIHASDAKAPAQEGLQIGEGAIDFSFLKNVKVPVLVEIWKGHENGGAGFRLGIERLRALEKTW